MMLHKRYCSEQHKSTLDLDPESCNGRFYRLEENAVLIKLEEQEDYESKRGLVGLQTLLQFSCSCLFHNWKQQEAANCSTSFFHLCKIEHERPDITSKCMRTVGRWVRLGD